MARSGGRFRFEDDVANERFKAAEDAVIPACRDALYEVHDIRDQHTYADFILTGGMGRKTLDVKFDGWFEETENVVFEDFHEYEDGTRRLGWGHSDLDWLGIVGASCQWVSVFDVPLFRALVDLNRHHAVALGWKPYTAENERNGRPYVTHGLCVPERDLRRQGALRMRWPLGRYLGG